MLHTYIYSKAKLSKVTVDALPKVSTLKKSKSCVWVAAVNPTGPEIQQLSETFKLHPTVAEDITQASTPVKYEEFDNNTLVVLKGVKTIAEDDVTFYTVSLINGPNYVISVHYTNQLDTVDKLLNNPKKIGYLLKQGDDFVFHYIIDKEIDKYVDTRVHLARVLRAIEDSFLEEKSKESFEKLFAIERILIEIQQRVDTLTDICLMLKKPKLNFIQKSLLPYFRDVYDHVLKVNQELRTYLERIDSLRSSYFSLTSHKLNETIQILTIVMALMMPMTIITSFYGMNIALPFQGSPYAYLFLILFMLFTVIIMLILLMKFGWIGKHDSKK